MAERTPKAPLPPMSSYTPPQPAFRPCALCGRLLRLGTDGTVTTALLGKAHVCNEKETVCP